jgi:hypothetical protein
VKVIYFVFLLIISVINVNAKDIKHAVYCELGGSGFYYSLNYEVKYYDFGLRVGGAFLRFEERNTGAYLNTSSFPISLFYSKPLGKSRSFIEGGAGVMNHFTNGNLVEGCSNKDWFVNPFISIAYKYRFYKEHLFLRVNTMLIWGSQDKMGKIGYNFEPYGLSKFPWIGIGVGWDW